MIYTRQMEKEHDEQLRKELPVRTLENEIELLVNYYGKKLTKDEKNAMKTGIITLINKGK
jgi:hypothetical protein